MDFSRTPEQEFMVKMAREFAEKELAPTLEEREEKELFDPNLYFKMGELGFPGIPFPEEYGGAGSDNLTYVMVCEEIAKVESSMTLALSVTTSLFGSPVYLFGTEEQKQKYLVPIAEGRALGSFGLTEPNAGTDAGGVQTTAVLDGDSYILNGTKIFITNAGESDYYVVFALTDKSKGTKGMSAFILEKGMPGFSFGKKEKKMGIRTSVQRELIFQDCRVPKENLLGQEGQGFKIAMMALDSGRLGVAAQAIGIAESAYQHALKYSKERIQFGKPISANQAVSFTLADMATQIDAARLLLYRAAYLKDKGLPFSKEASMAKMYASDVAMKVTTDAVQIYGGYGFTREYPVERLMRDAKITQIYEGTNQAQRMVIAGNILR